MKQRTLTIDACPLGGYLVSESTDYGPIGIAWFNTIQVGDSLAADILYAYFAARHYALTVEILDPHRYLFDSKE